MTPTYNTKPVTGPARSRRFGLSLNINFGTPGHSCGWNCVYCPWRMPESAGKPAEKPPTPTEAILTALRAKLEEHPEVETVIFGGNTEPTTHPGFSKIADEALRLRKELKGAWALICLSNGSGLEQASAHHACNRLDQTWVKLDCAEDVLFQKANKPDSKATKSIAAYTENLKKLRELRLQTTLWRYPDKTGFQNWSAENLRELLEAYRQLEPSAVHLVTVKKQRVYEGVQPVSYDEMEAFALRVAELGISVEVFA